MATMEHFTTQGSIAFVGNVFKSIEEAQHDLDLSIVLDTEKAMYLYELINCSDNLVMESQELENEFGELSNKCLVTVFKTGNLVTVIAEDLFQEINGEKTIKYHEAELLIVAQEDIELVKKYFVKKIVVVDFVSEKEMVRKLLFG